MKTIITTLISIFSFISVYSQDIDKLHKADTIYFYGYDFSHFSLVEPKRITESAQPLVFDWIDYLTDRVTKKDLETGLSKPIVYDFTHSTKRNKSINKDEKDSLI